MNKKARKLAQEQGISYMQALQQVRPARAQLSPYEVRWRDLSQAAKAQRCHIVKQDGRILLIWSDEWEGSYDGEIYDVAIHTNFADTEEGLASALAWLEAEYSENAEKE